ncbi:ATP-binding protein [Pseudomonas sp. MYb118]
MLIASQFPREQWYDQFSNPTIADAILDRIIHKAHVLSQR